jgi:hypothetical protein
VCVCREVALEAKAAEVDAFRREVESLIEEARQVAVLQQQHHHHHQPEQGWAAGSCDGEAAPQPQPQPPVMWIPGMFS